MSELGFKDDHEAGVLRLESDDGTIRAQSFAYNPVRVLHLVLSNVLMRAVTQTLLSFDAVVKREVQDA